MQSEEEAVMLLCCGLVVVFAVGRCWLDAHSGHHGDTVEMESIWTLLMRWGRCCIACVMLHVPTNHWPLCTSTCVNQTLTIEECMSCGVQLLT